MKRKHLSGLTVLLLLAFSACGTADKEPQAPETIVINDPAADDLPEQTPVTGEDILPEQTPATGEDSALTEGDGVIQPEITEQPDSGEGSRPVDGEQDQVQTYQDIYYQAVEDSLGDVRVYSLVYLDNDEIPELVMLDREFDFYSVYTVKDGALFCMVDSAAAVEMVYYERTGMYYEFARFNGGGDEGDYARFFYQVSTEDTITQETPCLMQEAYHALYTQEGVLNENGGYSYVYRGEDVDEGTYNELLSGFGVTEDGGRLFIENAVGKEEMLALLSK